MRCWLAVRSRRAYSTTVDKFEAGTSVFTSPKFDLKRRKLCSIAACVSFSVPNRSSVLTGARRTQIEIPPMAKSVTRRMRSYVRRWVNEWDLRRLYPGSELVAEDEQEMKPTYEADEDLEVPSEQEVEH